MLLLLQTNSISCAYTQAELIELGLSVAAGQLGFDEIVDWIRHHQF